MAGTLQGVPSSAIPVRSGGTGSPPFGATPLGFHQESVSNTAIGLPSIPAGATVAYCYVAGAGLLWRDDGVAPTNTVGFPWASGTSVTFSASLSTIKVIAASGTGTLSVSYYA